MAKKGSMIGPGQEKQALGEIVAWARQTIAFAIGIRARDTDKRIEPERAELVLAEAEATIDELWEKSLEKLPKDVPFQEKVEAFATEIFSWCYSHMNPQK